MFRKKRIEQAEYDRENLRPVLRCSICNGERVAGFKNIHTGEFKEEIFIRDDEELEAFKRKYKITELTNEYNFTDKELHFLIIGALGMMMIFVVHPLFKWLARNNHIMVISWIYVFTLIIVVTFAIEIGQRVTHTGSMEFADIVFGVMGFICMFVVFSIVRGIYHLILRLLGRRRWGEPEYEE